MRDDIDEYSWLRDSNWPDVKDNKILEFLNKENRNFNSLMQSSQKMTDMLFNEVKGKISAKDSTVPVKRDEYYYYSFINEGQEYWSVARKRASLDAKEEIILDENKLAEGQDFLNVRSVSVSPLHNLVGYSVDYDGNERYSLFIKEINSDTLLSDKIENTFGNIVWHESQEGFFYTPATEEWRAKEVLYHKIGTSQSEDRVIYHEDDATFSVGISKSESKSYLFITTESKNASECYFIDMADPKMSLHIIERRKENHLYYVSHNADHFFILTNDKGENFRVAKVLIDHPDQSNWKAFIEHDPEVYLQEMNLYQNHIVISSKRLGLDIIEVRNLKDGSVQHIDFPDQSYTAHVCYTTFDDDGIRFSYSALNTPNSVREYSLKSGEITTLKEQFIPSGFNKAEYKVERIWAPSREDGIKVPISIVYKKSLFKK